MTHLTKANSLLIAFILTLMFVSKALAASDIKSNQVVNSFRYQGFVNQFGQAIAPSDLDKKFVLVNFIFTGCGATCPLQTAEMVKFQNHLPDDLRSKVYIISVSVNPFTDTPKKLLKFAKEHKADLRGWSFLQGEKDSYERLRNEFVAIKPDKDGKLIDFNLHTTDVSLFDINGRFIQRYHGTPLNSKRVVEDIRALISLQKY